MKKTIILLAALLVLAACSADNGVDATATFIGGTQGLKVDFVDNFPPQTVSDRGQDTFQVILELTNKGEAEILAEDVQVRLTGFSPSLFGTTLESLTMNAPETIEANIMNPDGSIVSSLPVEIEFVEFAYQEAVQGTQQFPIRADMCYKYQTRIVSTLCVKEDFRRDQQGDICQVTSTRNAANSAAPIQVTNIRQTAASSDRTRFTLTVQNRDGGKVFQDGSLCSTESRQEDRVLMTINGLDDVDCRGLRDGTGNSGYLTLGSEGSAEIVCDAGFVERNERIQPFEIILDYDYEERIQKQISIERSD